MTSASVTDKICSASVASTAATAEGMVGSAYSFSNNHQEPPAMAKPSTLVWAEAQKTQAGIKRATSAGTDQGKRPAKALSARNVRRTGWSAVLFIFVAI